MAAAVLIFCGIGFGVLRLALGPTVIDRIVAVDALTIVSISTMALYALVAERFIYLERRAGLWRSELSRRSRRRALP